ncbi:tetraspanin-4 [Sceloporus undulatus]|uniref:tetraspanin-4 n=1 Tax=Sceloporus undulatus TaxID=8520 RepID=UPI001C4A90DC|nr:tetraspanin-4 [Sceloporus undulatus]
MANSSREWYIPKSTARGLAQKSWASRGKKGFCYPRASLSGRQLGCVSARQSARAAEEPWRQAVPWKQPLRLLEPSRLCQLLSSIDLVWHTHKSELKRCSMAHNCLQCIKYLMFVFNLLFWLGGCGILGVGIWLAVTQGNFATLSSSFPSLSAANLLIITGTFVMIIGFVGCIGAIKENKCLLLSIDKYAQRDLKKGLHLYGTDGNIGLTNAWSIIQTDFRCCGVSNYTDWFEVYNTTRVPDSCCLEFSENCGLHSPGTWWKAPCYETVKIWLQENLLAVGIFGLCTALVQILGLTFAMTMYCQVVKTDTYCA